MKMCFDSSPIQMHISVSREAVDSQGTAFDGEFLAENPNRVYLELIWTGNVTIAFGESATGANNYPPVSGSRIIFTNPVPTNAVYVVVSPGASIKAFEGIPSEDNV